MAKFQPGQSGNPKGKPPKLRALTTMLAKEGDTYTLDAEGKKVLHNTLVTRLVWEVVTTGKATMPGGKMYDFDAEDWLATVKFLYAQVDGPPKQQMEVGGPDGKPIETKATVTHVIDGDTATNIFDILTAAGALPSAPSDAETQ